MDTRNLPMAHLIFALLGMILLIIAALAWPAAPVAATGLTTSTPASTIAAPPAVPPAAPTVSSHLDTAALDAYVQQMMRVYDVPGSAIAVIQDGKVVHVQAYGVRDTTSQQPVTTRTMFALGSLTKSFTSLGVMLLVQDGKVRLDEPVVTYLPQFRLSDPAVTPKVTVRHLLSHTTGLAYDSSTITHQDMTPDELFALVARLPVVNAPGTTFTYNNVNADVAGQLIEHVSGQPWQDYVRQRIFSPMAMSESDFDFSKLPQKPDHIAFHQRDALAGMQPIPFYPIGVDMPSAGIITNVENMARYVTFQLTGRTPAGAQLLDASLLEEMHTRQVSAAGGWTTPDEAAFAAKQQGVSAPQTLLTNTGYAFYWLTNGFNGQRMVWHDGGGAGFVANITLLPESQSGVVILTNADRANDFTDTVRQYVAEALLNTQPRHDIYAIVQSQLKLLDQDVASRTARLEAARSYQADPAALQALAGDYRTPNSDIPTRVTVLNGRELHLLSAGTQLRIDSDLVPYESDSFLINSGDLKGSGRIVFVHDQGGSTSIHLLFGGSPPIVLAQR